MHGLTTEERSDKKMLQDYSRRYESRQGQLEARLPDNPSKEYRKTLMLRYQRLRDMRQVCFVHSNYEEEREPEIIQECKRKRIEYEAEMNMLLLAFPFLGRMDSHFLDDI